MKAKATGAAKGRGGKKVPAHVEESEVSKESELSEPGVSSGEESQSDLSDEEDFEEEEGTHKCNH